MKVLEKVITAIISGLILSLGLSFMNGSMEFFNPFLMVSWVIYLTGGISFSIIADIIVKKIKSNKYLYNLVIYGTGGIVVNVLFYIRLYDDGFVVETLHMLLLGIVAALIFLHVLLFTKKVLKSVTHIPN